MCAATTALIARALGDTLLLSKLGSGVLPVMYVISALVTGLASWACARMAPRASTSQIATFVAGGLIVTNVAASLSLSVLPVAARATAYLLADLSGRLPILLFWAFAGEIFDAAESRRLFGLLGAMGTAACLPAGLLVGPMARRFGVASLFPIVCVLLASFVALLRALDRQRVDERTGKGPDRLATTNRFSAGLLHRNRQFLTIAALAAVTALVQTLVDYQFKSSFSSRASGAALAGIFGRLYAYTSLVALFLQLFLVHRILKWGGVWVSLSALPAALLAASLGIVRTSSAAWVYAAKAIDITLTLTVNGTARQMLYRGIRSESRLQARALAEGLYQPAAIALAGSALALTIDSLTVRILAAITIAGCALWAVLARGAYSQYVSGLLASLRAARFSSSDEPLAAHEPAVKKYVMTAMASGGEDVRYLAAVLPNVLPLGDHADPEVRWTVLRAAAAGEFRASDSWLLAKLGDEHPRVRAFAAAALLNDGRGAARDKARETLERLAASPSAADGRAAAEGLGEVRRGSVSASLLPLLAASDDDVLEAALEASVARPDAALVPAILTLLGRRRVAARAADALVAVGPDAVLPAARFLRTVPLHIRAVMMKTLARALARRGDPVAVPLVTRMLRVAGSQDRAPLFQAWADLTRRRKPSPAELEQIDARILVSIAKANARLAEARHLGDSMATQLLRSAVAHLARCHVRHAFILLDARVTSVNMHSLHAAHAYGSRESRSQVVELLSNVLPQHLQVPVLDVLAQSEAPSAEAQDAAPLVVELLEQHASGWVTAGAIHALGMLAVVSERERIRIFLSHDDPILRETALAALQQMEDRPAFLLHCQSLAGDPDHVVHKLARSMLDVPETERSS